MQSKYIPGWVCSPPAGYNEFLLQQISPTTSERKLGQKAILFGRVEKVCDVVVNHVSASRVHACVAFDGAGILQLADLGSTHGTFLDGDRLAKNEQRQLHFDESVISFGLSPLKFKLIGPPLSRTLSEAANQQAPDTAAISDDVHQQQARASSGAEPASPLHSASPVQHDANQAEHQQQQEHNQQHQQQLLQQERDEHQSMTVPAAQHLVVGEELDARASATAATEASALLPPQDSDQPAADTLLPTDAPTTKDVAGEEQDLKASAPAAESGSETSVAQKTDRDLVSALPKLESALHEQDQIGVTANGVHESPPPSQTDITQAETQQAQEGNHTSRHSHHPSAHEDSHGRGLGRHRKRPAAAAGSEAMDVEDGEVPHELLGDPAQASQKAANAVVGEELHSKASTEELNAGQTSSGPPSNGHDRGVTGEELDPKAATSGFAGSSRRGQASHSSRAKHPANAPVGEELDGRADNADGSRHPKRRRATPPNPISPTPSAAPAAASHGHNSRSDGRAGGRTEVNQRHAAEPVRPGSSRDNVRDPPAEHAGSLQHQTSSDRKAAANAESARSPRDRQGIQQKQQHSASGTELVSGSGSGSGSGSDSDSHPAPALALPSWRQQEQLEPEREPSRAGQKAGDKADHRPGARAQARPFSRSGSHPQHCPHSAASQDASSRSHHRDPGSLETPAHHSASGRSHPQDRPSGKGKPCALPGPAPYPNRQDRSPSGIAGSDRPNFQQPSTVGDARGHFNGHLHRDRQHQQQSQELRPSRDTRPVRHDPLGGDPSQAGPHPPQHPRRPFTRDGTPAKPPIEAGGRLQSRNPYQSREQFADPIGHQAYPRGQESHPSRHQPYPREDVRHPREHQPHPREDQPRFGEDQPRPREQQPHPRQHQPHHREDQPRFGENQPHPREQQPHHRQHQPHHREDQPRFGENQPRPREQQPHHRQHQPHHREDQPRFGENQLRPREHQPHPREDQPRFGENQPRPRENQPRPREQQPHTREGQPHHRDQSHPRGAHRHVGQTGAHDGDPSHGNAVMRRNFDNRPGSGVSDRRHSRPSRAQDRMHPNTDLAQSDRSAGHSQYADRDSGMRDRSAGHSQYADRDSGMRDKSVGYSQRDTCMHAQTDKLRRAGSNRDSGGQERQPSAAAKFDEGTQAPSQSRSRHTQSEGGSHLSQDALRRHTSGQRESSRGSRGAAETGDKPPRGSRSSRDHQDSGAKRRRSRSRSVDRGSDRRRKETGFSGEAGPPPHVAADPTSAAAAVMRMQGHPTGTGLSLQQKKSKLWGSKALTADPAQADAGYGSNRWDTAAFANATDKEKFSRLMGVKNAASHGIPDIEDRELFSKERQDQVLGDLESQFISGLRRKDGRTVGLGL